jgi:hypothetical protein
MAGDMSVDEAPDTPAGGVEIERFGSVVIVGGGCYGRYYVRQLQRAARAGAIAVDRLIVVDRDPLCAVATDKSASDREPWPVSVEIAAYDWHDFFPKYLNAAADMRVHATHDAIVPSPLMPHLMAEWLVSRARERWPARVVTTAPLEHAPRLPWQRAGDDGTHYVSYADWICPINCIEPRTCPHTRTARDWSLATWLPSFARDGADAVESEQRAAVVLHCRHRTYGVGMFDTEEVIGGDDTIRRVGEAGRGEVMIGTVSHCHGAITRLVIGPAEAA